MRRFIFKVFDKELINFIEKLPDFSQSIREILTKLKDGEIIDTTDIDLELKKAVLALRKSQKLRIDIDNRLRLVHELRLSPEKAIEISTGRESLHVIVQTELICPICEENFNIKEFPVRKNIDLYLDHMRTQHHSEPTEEIKNKLMKLIELEGT